MLNLKRSLRCGSNGWVLLAWLIGLGGCLNTVDNTGGGGDAGVAAGGGGGSTAGNGGSSGSGGSGGQGIDAGEKLDTKGQGGTGGTRLDGAADATRDTAPIKLDTAPPAGDGSVASGGPWRVDSPCVRMYPSFPLCYEVSYVKDARAFTGDPGRIYDVTFRVRGIVEGRKYWNPTRIELPFVAPAPYFKPATQANPSDASDPHNDLQAIYTMTVSDPAGTYYLNVGYIHGYYTYVIDYNATVKIKSGATVTFAMSDAGVEACQTVPGECGVQITNGDNTAMPTVPPAVIPDIPPAPKAFNGQFVQADIIDMK